jgi:hypothetical protein
MREEVQWYGSSGSGVRSWKLYGVTRVHLLDAARPGRTLCGVKVPRPSKQIVPESKDPRCLRCAARDAQEGQTA